MNVTSLTMSYLYLQLIVQSKVSPKHKCMQQQIHKAFTLFKVTNNHFTNNNKKALPLINRIQPVTKHLIVFQCNF